ncbi:universal stress protein UspE [Aurantivibrio plasticivorans]
MSDQEQLLVIVDPTQDEHPALERALLTSRIRPEKPKVHILICVDPDAVDTKAENGKVYRPGEWFLDLIKPFQEENLSYQTEFCWSLEWRDAILHTSARIKPSLILLPDYPSERKTWFTDAKWMVLRNSECPVLIVRPNADAQRKTVLAAINTSSDSERYRELNVAIVVRAAWMAERYGADLHLVTAYSDSMKYPDKGQLARKANVSADHIHVKQGEPVDVIADVAKELDADVVVIGTMARQGMLAAMRGNTSEKLLSRLDMDVMTLN